MKYKLMRLLCVFMSVLVCYSSFVGSVYAAETEEESVSATESEDTPEEETTEESWIDVAGEVLKYYAENSAGLEPLITERNRRFYNVIADDNVDLQDVSYFLDMYAAISAGIEFEGYIPKRDNSVSPVTGTVTETATTTVTTTTTAAKPTTTTTKVTTITTTKPTTTTTKKTTTITEKTTAKTTTTGKTTTVSKTTATTTGVTTTSSYIWSASEKLTTLATTTTTTASTAGPTKPTTTATTKTTKATTKTTVSGETTGSTVSGETTVTETTTVTTTTVITRTPHSYGIDVSIYQGEVDWQAVADSGVEFAIIRAGYGKHISQKDKNFDKNMEGAKEAGLSVGAYWFCYATTVEAALLEADVFYEVIKDYQFEYPIFMDYETNAQYQMEPEENAEIIHAFCERMESYGYYVSLCSYVNFLTNRVPDEVFDAFDSWIAHYNVQVPLYERNYGIWQFSCTGEVPGIEADVDLNYSYYDYPSIIKRKGLNGFALKG